MVEIWLKYFLLGLRVALFDFTFLKKCQLIVFQQVFLPVPTLLHDLGPFVQGCPLVGKHNLSFLFQTEATSTGFFAVNWGLFDDIPL